ncbi:HAMP domain-containing histidine kinase [Leucobacter viscericola]|uniref:histidine kinase n=1 Tax=Leucobacter viscericola TaxID=2714935 RepID=A0A6G7XC72_9MICO|nr:HAMP domain-containing sensor histidine kinase [Leucobacter viscericola]QIK61971.1 HAMP domain-containing histidine kinase [Leucobacter viscericola]
MHKRFRLTIRARLTLSFALLFAVGGGLIVTLLNVFMRFGPVWSLTGAPAQSADPSTAPTAPDSLPFQDLNDGTSMTTSMAPNIEIRNSSDVLNTLMWSSIIALILIVAIGSVAAWFLAGRLLAPLHTINEAARSATPDRLDRRVGLTGPRDELRELSDTLDEMLARIERAFTAQRLFTSNASHELRTPLATEKAMLDMLLDGPAPSETEYRAVAERLREVNARSIAMVGALLELGRAQGLRVASGVGEGPLEGSANTEGINLHNQHASQLLADPLARCRESAAEIRIAVHVDVSDHMVAAHRQLVEQLLDNLLQNAVRHGLTGGDMWINWSAKGEVSILRVKNVANPIPTAERERLLEPFVRAEARVRGAGGSGLGLAIASAIAEAHGGTLLIEKTAPDRFAVRVELPLSEQSVPAPE